jgi:membrane-associated phospholipid phosphatase
MMMSRDQHPSDLGSVQQGGYVGHLETVRRRRLLAAIFALVLLTLTLSALAAGSGVLPGDVWLAGQVQRTQSDAGDVVAASANWLGSLPGIAAGAIAIAAVFAINGRWSEAVLVLGTVVVRGINPFLKWMLNSPRPTIDLVGISEQATGLGFPSGHSMGVALLYGMSAYLASRLIEARSRLVWMVAMVPILATGYARIYTGAHWPSDVLGGYVWGACVALLFLGAAHVVGVRPAPVIGGRDTLLEDRRSQSLD